MAKDKDYRRLIHTARWLRLRKWKLTAQPMCESCGREGRMTLAREVHHIRPVEYGMNLREKEQLMFDPTNLMSLCHDCHVAEHVAMGRSGREATRRRNAARRSEILARFFGPEESTAIVER